MPADHAGSNPSLSASHSVQACSDKRGFLPLSLSPDCRAERGVVPVYRLNARENAAASEKPTNRPSHALRSVVAQIVQLQSVPKIVQYLFERHALCLEIAIERLPAHTHARGDDINATSPLCRVGMLRASTRPRVVLDFTKSTSSASPCALSTSNTKRG